jgi:hypothetical protein
MGIRIADQSEQKELGESDTDSDVVGIVLSIILSSTLITLFPDVFESMDGFTY